MTIITPADLPDIRGRYIAETPLSKYTWLRVGGAADVLFQPADDHDLADFLRACPSDIPVIVIGVGSNLLVRDGGVRGVVIRLGAPLAKIYTEGTRVTAGAAALDASVAKNAARAGIAGLEFFRGIPGTIGGALRMNAGAYGGETKDLLVEATALDRDGVEFTFTPNEMDYTYRHCGLPEKLIFTKAVFQGEAGDTDEITARMADIMKSREATQPIKERTGGSTFKNPDGHKSWQLIDSVGGRGRCVGDAQFSQLHCNFLINKGNATAADLENLGEGVREDVLRETGVALEWEIKRIGEKG